MSLWEPALIYPVKLFTSILVYTLLWSTFGFCPRDLRDIGCYIKVIDGCQQLDKETRFVIFICWGPIKNAPLLL